MFSLILLKESQNLVFLIVKPIRISIKNDAKPFGQVRKRVYYSD